MTLPLKLIWTVKIGTKQKLGLVGVFGIATIIIVVSIIRAVEVTTRARTDGVLLTVWSVIESTVCMHPPGLFIVGILCSFKDPYKLEHPQC